MKPSDKPLLGKKLSLTSTRPITFRNNHGQTSDSFAQSSATVNIAANSTSQLHVFRQFADANNQSSA